MANFYSENADKFNQLSLRERMLIVVTVIVILIGAWMHFYLEPLQADVKAATNENNRISREVDASRIAVNAIKKRIAAGVHREKDQQLTNLREEFDILEDQLRLKTVELIDPAQMFDLIGQLIYEDSKIQLKSLSRQNVRPAIPVLQGEEDKIPDPQIYRHVMVVEFSGGYEDILRYVEKIENLDWKLIWDQIVIVSEEYPAITVRLVISTLSTNKEWVGV